MTTTSAPARSTDPRRVRLLAVVAIVACVACVWGLWASQIDDTQAHQDCILAKGRYAAAGRPSHIAPPSCS